jgi:SAM-dependent methyltransferase
MISSFNGVDLPYPSNYFDLIFCRQVLEHVRHPDKLIADVFRVLKPGGLFMSSVSYLEPYHSYSIFNFTPYGIVRVFVDAGFKLVEIRPGIDASVLINRQLFNRSKLLSPIWKINFLYKTMSLIGRIFNLEHRECNFLKIQFSGHIVFLARNPVEYDNK